MRQWRYGTDARMIEALHAPPSGLIPLVLHDGGFRRKVRARDRVRDHPPITETYALFVCQPLEIDEHGRRWAVRPGRRISPCTWIT